MLRKTLVFVLIITVLIAIGCSSGGGENVVMPDEQSRGSLGTSSHQLWGMWQFTADPVAQTLEIVPLRGVEMHLNALHFLEPPVMVNLTLESIEFNGNIVEAVIGLKHPFLGLNEFSGFDVCGIFITNGGVTGFSNPDLRMAGEGDTRLLNPDGHSRWWNPAEFPINNGTMFSYQDGLLGTPDSIANYDCTLNGYKFFCDDLTDPDSPLSDITIEGRALFSAGQKNIRHYTIELGGGLIFNYAIDANWAFPSGQKPWKVPDDFPPEANRPEAWRISVTELENTLYNDGVEFGGDLSLAIDVYDHFNADLNNVRAEAPSEIPATESNLPTGGGEGYNTYQVDIIDCTPAASGELELLVTIESDVDGYGGLLPGEPVSAYFTYTTTVDDEVPVTDPWSEEFEILSDDNGRFPVIDQSPSERIIAGWSSNPGIKWSEFTFPDSWDTPGVVDPSIDSTLMSIEPGYSGDDLYLHGGSYAGTTNVNGVQFEIEHPTNYKWDGATGWDKWVTGATMLCSHYYNDFQNKHHVLLGTYASYGYPMHIQYSNWKQAYPDYFQDYYDGYNMHEYGYSRCWDDDSNGYAYVTYESDRMKGIYLPKIDYRYVKVAIQYLPTTAPSDHSHHTIDEGSNDYLDSPVIAIDSNDVKHVAYRRYIDSTSTWQIVHRWSSTGTSWSSVNETVVWSGGFEPEWRYVSIDIDTQDRIHLTYGVSDQIWYTRSDNGLDWIEAEWVNESIEGLVNVLDRQQWMCVDADDQVHVVWARRSDTPGVEFGTIRHRWRQALP